jgi:hypothetical protein
MPSSGSVWVRQKITEGTFKRAVVGLGVIYSGDTHQQASSASLRRYDATAPGYVLVNAMARYAFQVGVGCEVSTQFNLSNFTD